MSYKFPLFEAFWKSLSPTEKREFAAAVDSTLEYMKQIRGGHSRPSPRLARRIESVSAGATPAAEFHPEVFG